MHESMIVFLINKNVRGLLCQYEAGEKAPKDFVKTLDPTIKVGDLVVVQTADTHRHGMTISKVVAVDVPPNFDLNDFVKWAYLPVPMDSVRDLMAKERQAIEVVQRAELKKKQDQLRESMLGAYADEVKALPLTVINGDHPTGSPPPETEF